MQVFLKTEYCRDISKFTIAIATDSYSAKGKAYIDDIKAYVDKSITQIVNTGYIAPPLEDDASIIDLNTAELKEYMDYHPDGGISSFDIIEVADQKQLKWAYDYDSAANKYWSMIRHFGFWNMSANQGLSFRIQGNKSNNKLVVQLKDADGEFFYLKLLVDFDNEIEIKIPFNTLMLKGVDDGGMEVDGILHTQIINEISFTMESNVYDSSAKGGTLYLSDIAVFNDSTVAGLTVDGVDIQSVDLFHDFEKDSGGEEFDITSLAFADADGVVEENDTLFGERALKVTSVSKQPIISFERSPQLANASGIAFWVRSSHSISLDFVLQTSDGKDYKQTKFLSKGLNLIVFKINNFKSGSSVISIATAEIDNYYIVLNNSSNAEIEVLFDNFYAYNVYNSAALGRMLAEMIGKEMLTLPMPDDIDEDNFEAVKETTTIITSLILENAENAEIVFSLVSLAPYIEAFFAVLNKLDDIEISRRFELGSIFKINMVAQHGQDFTVYGFGRAQEQVEVKFAGVTLDTVADETGRFEVVFPAEIMTPSTVAKLLEVKGEGGRSAEVAAILVGNVYMVMGQSSLLNDVPLGLSFTKNKNVRIYTANSVLSGSPEQVTLSSSWGRTDTSNYMYGNSIISYIANKIFEQDTSMPIGIITVAYGIYTPFEAYAGNEAIAEMLIDSREGYHACTIYNTYIHPLLGVKLAGVIMAHGGSMVTDTARFSRIMQDMQQDMQAKFSSDELPFYIVQSVAFSRFTEFSYNAAQSLLVGKEGFNIIPATDVTQLNPDGLAKIALRLTDSLTGNVSYPYVTSIEPAANGYIITFSENVAFTGSFLDGFWLGNAQGNFDENAIATILGNTVRVTCSMADFDYNNVFYNINGKGNLVSASGTPMPIGSFGTFAPYNPKSYNYIDEMKYENKEDFDNIWAYRIAGATQENSSGAVTLVSGENKINFKYFNKGMQILATPVNTTRVSRDITDIRVWVKTTEPINFQCYLWFGSYPADTKRYNTALNVDYRDGGYVYIPIAGVWGSTENFLDSLTHIGIGLDRWAEGSMQIGAIDFEKAEQPGRFELIKPAFGGVVIPDTPIEFLWLLSARAEKYSIEIKDKDGVVIHSKDNIQDFYYIYPQGLAEGTYSYSVTAINTFGEYTTNKYTFLSSEIARKDTLFYDFEMTGEEFAATFKYRNSQTDPPWDDITSPIYASIAEVQKENGEQSKALKIDSTLAPDEQKNYYLAIRGALDGNEAFGARYLKFWCSSNVELASLNETARIEINLYMGSNHYYTRLYDVPAGEGYIFVSLNNFKKGSASYPDFALSMVDNISIGINVSYGAIVYFDDISLTYKKE